MLKVCYRLNELDLTQLMAVYEEGNMENGKEFFPVEAPEVQLRKAEETFEAYLREDFFHVNGAYYAIWQEEGSYRSALRMEPYQDGWLLEALETHPSNRRMGFATKLITAVLARMPAGSCVYSHVGKRNTASLAAHRHCGFSEYLDYAKYVDGTVTQNSCTMKIIL